MSKRKRKDGPDSRDGPGCLVTARHVLHTVSHCDPRTLSFETSYREIYTRALAGRGAEMLRIFITACWRLALCKDDTSDVRRRLVVIADVCLYLQRFAVLPLRHMALRVLQHPARLAVRRLYGVLRRGAFVRRCRRAFDEVRLRPGGSGFIQAKAEFETFI